MLRLANHELARSLMAICGAFAALGKCRRRGSSSDAIGRFFRLPMKRALPKETHSALAPWVSFVAIASLPWHGVIRTYTRD